MWGIGLIFRYKRIRWKLYASVCLGIRESIGLEKQKTQKLNIVITQRAKINKLKIQWTGHIKISIIKTVTMAEAVYQAYAAIFLHFPDLGFMYSHHPVDDIGGVMEGNTIQYIRNFKVIQDDLESLEFFFGCVGLIVADS